jgi:hypothetical protein
LINEKNVMEEIMQSRTLIILLTLALLTACAPANIATPTVTAQPPTATAEPSPTVTVIATKTAPPTEVPATHTPEARSYTLHTDPRELDGSVVLTADDLKGPHAKWVDTQCIIPPAPKTVFKVISDETGLTVLNAKKNDGTFDHARNTQICDYDVFDPAAVGMPDKDPLYLISEPYADIFGTQATFQFAMGQAGIDYMDKNQFIGSDKYGPRIIPMTILSNDRQSAFLLNGKPGGKGDPRMFTEDEIEKFYNAQTYNGQPVTLKMVNDALTEIGNTNRISPENKKFIESIVILGVPLYPPTSN